MSLRFLLGAVFLLCTAALCSTDPAEPNEPDEPTVGCQDTRLGCHVSKLGSMELVYGSDGRLVATKTPTQGNVIVDSITYPDETTITFGYGKPFTKGRLWSMRTFHLDPMSCRTVKMESSFNVAFPPSDSTVIVSTHIYQYQNNYLDKEYIHTEWLAYDRKDDRLMYKTESDDTVKYTWKDGNLMNRGSDSYVYSSLPANPVSSVYAMDRVLDSFESASMMIMSYPNLFGSLPKSAWTGYANSAYQLSYSDFDQYGNPRLINGQAFVGYKCKN